MLRRALISLTAARALVASRGGPAKVRGGGGALTATATEPVLTLYRDTNGWHVTVWR